MDFGLGLNFLSVDKLLIWITPIPNTYSSRTSPVFSLMGSDWCFKFDYCIGQNYHCISLHQLIDGKISPKNEQLKTPFHVRTYMMDTRNNGDDAFESKRTSVYGTRTEIWNAGCVKNDIYKKLAWLYDCPEVKFVCKFYGHRCTFQLQIGTDNLFSATPTEDKSVQVSPGDLVDIGVQVSSEVPRDIESLSSDFSRLLDKEILPDVRLKCRDRTFRAHRSVLAARSDVFRAMFQNETLESETGDVTIHDMEVGMLQKLLEFVYSGRPDDLSEDCTSDLYEAADKYAVLSLKAACSYWIERNLAVENCVRYLKVADSHCDRDLKAAVISFIVGNPEVLKSESWLALSKELPVLAVEVFQAYVS